MTVTTADGSTKTFDTDEHPRPQSTLDGLMSLPASFRPDGVIHAGNSSGIVDGAAGVLLASKRGLERLGLKPRARIVDTVVVGSEPVIMLTGPIPACRKILQRNKMTAKDIDLVEVNEAFAGQYLAVEKELGLDRERTNVNGGAIALGHPLAATGTRLLLTLVLELRRRGARHGLATACIGGGQGIAMIVRRED